MGHCDNSPSHLQGPRSGAAADIYHSVTRHRTQGVEGEGKKTVGHRQFFFFISVLLQTAFGLDVVMMSCIRSCNNVIQQDFSLFVSIELPHGQIASSGRTKLFLAEAMML